MDVIYRSKFIKSLRYSARLHNRTDVLDRVTEMAYFRQFLNPPDVKQSHHLAIAFLKATTKLKTSS